MYESFDDIQKHLHDTHAESSAQVDNHVYGNEKISIEPHTIQIVGTMHDELKSDTEDITPIAGVNMIIPASEQEKRRIWGSARQHSNQAYDNKPIEMSATWEEVMDENGMYVRQLVKEPAVVEQQRREDSVFEAMRTMYGMSVPAVHDPTRRPTRNVSTNRRPTPKLDSEDRRLGFSLRRVGNGIKIESTDELGE